MCGSRHCTEKWLLHAVAWLGLPTRHLSQTDTDREDDQARHRKADTALWGRTELQSLTPPMRNI